MSTNLNITNKIEEALDQVRPFLQSDGGDIKLIDVSNSFKFAEF